MSPAKAFRAFAGAPCGVRVRSISLSHSVNRGCEARVRATTAKQPQEERMSSKLTGRAASSPNAVLSFQVNTRLSAAQEHIGRGAITTKGVGFAAFTAAQGP